MSTFSKNYIYEGSNIYNYINNRTYKENPYIKLEDLRYLVLLYKNFKNQDSIGRMIVNEKIADDILEIFKKLYEYNYQINSINLIEDYWNKNGLESDRLSMKNNNSSCFNYREIEGQNYLSYHALGLAIDINPLNNPYIIEKDGKLDYSSLSKEELYYANNRNSEIEHVITHNDLAYKLFKEKGFDWGGDWNSPLDYQHFEKKIIDNKILKKN